MDPLQILFSWQLILCCLAIATVIYFIRTLVEYYWTNAIKNKLYTELILPLLPIILGVISALELKRFPYPGFTIQPNGTYLRDERVIFWLVIGLLSGTVYRVIKSLLVQKIQQAEMPQYYPQQQWQQYPNNQQIPGQQIINNPSMVQPITNVVPDVSEQDLPNRGKL